MDLTRRLTSQAPFSQSKKHAEAYRIVVTSAGLLMVLFTCHLVTLACTCDLPNGRSVKQQVIESRKKSTAVFSGTVLEITSEPSSTFVLVRFKAETFWKGNNSSQVTVSTGRGSGDCGFHFEVGKRYLVYAYGPENVLQTNICQRTTSLSEATEDLRILGEAARTQQSRESRPENKVVKTNMSVAAVMGVGKPPIKYENRNQIDPPPLSISTASGRVISEVGELGESLREIGPVGGASVGLFTEKSHQLHAFTVADSEGYFKFERVPPGQYRLVIRADPLCVANVPLRVVTAAKNKESRRQIVVHMRAAGLDSCSYGDYGAPLTTSARSSVKSKRP